MDEPRGTIGCDRRETVEPADIFSFFITVPRRVGLRSQFSSDEVYTLLGTTGDGIMSIQGKFGRDGLAGSGALWVAAERPQPTENTAFTFAEYGLSQLVGRLLVLSGSCGRP